MRILAISGSLRRDSHNSRLLRHIAERAPAGIEHQIWDGLRSIPAYDADDDLEPAPPPVAELRQAIASADALLIATPEYNASIPGVLKNAIDWASRPRAATPLQNKPAAVIGASTGSFGAVWAQAELRKVLAHTGARVVDLDLPVAKADHAFDESGALLSDELARRCANVLAALVAEAHPSAEPLAA
ncbi:MAG: NADPH-dependent FMN reductase [Solirubrobacterales bacterium]